MRCSSGFFCLHMGRAKRTFPVCGATNHLTRGKRLDIKILIATHKNSRMPEDPVYVPIQVGAALHEPLSIPGVLRDDTGDSISARNPNYCELTALYWGWKNLSCAYLGIVHYRRYFSRAKGRGDKWARIAAKRDLEQELSACPLLLPKKRRYWIETTYDQYVHAHHAQDLDQTRAILSRKHPEYLSAFDRVMKQTSGHRFNMFVMRRDLLDAYCEWLFDVLFTLEEELDIRDYSANDARVFGFVSERLLDVWIEANGLPYREIPYLFMEKQNWLKKGGAFLKRKFIGK